MEKQTNKQKKSKLSDKAALKSQVAIKLLVGDGEYWSYFSGNLPYKTYLIVVKTF